MKGSEIVAATDTTLLVRFAEVAAIHRALQTPTQANRAFEEGIMIWQEFCRRGGDSINSFLTLLCAKEPEVRLMAAGKAIFLFPDESIPVLEELSEHTEMLGFSAKMTFKLWREGTLRPHPPI